NGSRHCREKVHSIAQRCRNRRTVEALAADHDEPSFADLARLPRPVKMPLQSVADRLHDLPAVAAGDVDKALDPGHAVQADRVAQTCEECIAFCHRATGHDKTLEIVVIMFCFEIMDRGPGGEVVLGRGGDTERYRHRHSPVSHAEEFDPWT